MKAKCYINGEFIGECEVEGFTFDTLVKKLANHSEKVIMRPQAVSMTITGGELTDYGRKLLAPKRHLVVTRRGLKAMLTACRELSRLN